MAVSKNTTKESIVLFTTYCILNGLCLLIPYIYKANLKQIYLRNENQEEIIQYANELFNVGYGIAYIIQGINMEIYGFQNTFFVQLSLLATFLIQIPLYENIFMINLLHMTLGFLSNFGTIFIAFILKHFEGAAQVRNICYLPLSWTVGSVLFTISMMNLSLPLNWVSDILSFKYFLLIFPNLSACLLILCVLFMIYMIFKYMDFKDTPENNDLGPINYGAIEVQSNDKTFISHVQLIYKSISKMDASTQLILSYLAFNVVSIASLTLMYINFTLPNYQGGLEQDLSATIVSIVVFIITLVYFKCSNIIQKHGAIKIYFRSVKYQTILLLSIISLLFSLPLVSEYGDLVAYLYLIAFILFLSNYILGYLAYFPMISQLENNKIGLSSMVGLCLSINVLATGLFLPWILSLYEYMLEADLEWLALFNPTWLLLLGSSFLHFKFLFKQNYQFGENLQEQF